MSGSTIKRFFRTFAIGALIGAILASWFGPRGIAWYAEPPAYIGISCKPAIEWAFGRFQYLQLFGVVAGGALSAFLGMSVFHKRKEIAAHEEPSN
jgi:hypothetical protein